MEKYQQRAELTAQSGDGKAVEKKDHVPAPSGKGLGLSLVDQSGKSVNFCPVTVWSGDGKANITDWDIQNLQAERILFAEDEKKFLEEIEDWIDVDEIKKVKIIYFIVICDFNSHDGGVRLYLLWRAVSVKSILL